MSHDEKHRTDQEENEVEPREGIITKKFWKSPGRLDETEEQVQEKQKWGQGEA